jgi:hypothetical protein
MVNASVSSLCAFYSQLMLEHIIRAQSADPPNGEDITSVKRWLEIAAKVADDFDRKRQVSVLVDLSRDKSARACLPLGRRDALAQPGAGRLDSIGLLPLAQRRPALRTTKPMGLPLEDSSDGFEESLEMERGLFPDRFIPPLAPKCVPITAPPTVPLGQSPVSHPVPSPHPPRRSHDAQCPPLSAHPPTPVPVPALRT